MEWRLAVSEHLYHFLKVKRLTQSLQVWPQKAEGHKKCGVHALGAQYKIWVQSWAILLTFHGTRNEVSSTYSFVSFSARPMSNILQHLAKFFRKSNAGKGLAQSPYFLIDYEKFLRQSGLDDGDERELAEKELALVASQSDGLCSIDRHPRSHAPERIRLNLERGEAWLFAQIGEPSPRQQRADQARFFELASGLDSIPERWRAAWAEALNALAQQTLHGESIHPFKRNDDLHNDDLLQALVGVLTWQGESLIRYASAMICGNSKRLAQLESPLLTILQSITGHSSLEDFGILHKPRAVTFHGPLKLSVNGGDLDFSCLPGPLSLSESNLNQSSNLSTTASLCLSIENEDVFHELAQRNPGVILILTSYPGAAVRKLFSLLPLTLDFYHFGDSDPSGFDILRDLREKTHRPIQPMLMMHSPMIPPELPVPLSAHEHQLFESLLENPTLTDLHSELLKIQQSGDKGKFEQEHIEIDVVIQSLSEIGL